MKKSSPVLRFRPMVEVLEDRAMPALLGPMLMSSPTNDAVVVQEAPATGGETQDTGIAPTTLETSPVLPPPSSDTIPSYGPQFYKWQNGKLAPTTEGLNFQLRPRSPYVQITTGFAAGEATVLRNGSIIYSEPAWLSEKIGQAQRGDKFKYIGFKNGWVEVQLENGTGFIHIKNFTSTKYIPPPSLSPPSNEEIIPGGAPKG